MKMFLNGYSFFEQNKIKQINKGRKEGRRHRGFFRPTLIPKVKKKKKKKKKRVKSKDNK